LGQTVYAYVGGNPVSYIDPLGLWGWDFNAGGHVLLPGGAAIGPNFNASYVPGQGFDGATSTAGLEAEFGAVWDVGVSAGVNGLSSCANGKRESVTFTLPFFGKYGGVTLNFEGGQFDGLDLGLGVGWSLPITATVPLLEWW
jgi:hypothetical protein